MKRLTIILVTSFFCIAKIPAHIPNVLQQRRITSLITHLNATRIRPGARINTARTMELLFLVWYVCACVHVCVRVCVCVCLLCAQNRVSTNEWMA